MWLPISFFSIYNLLLLTTVFALPDSLLLYTAPELNKTCMWVTKSVGAKGDFGYFQPSGAAHQCSLLTGNV